MLARFVVCAWFLLRRGLLVTVRSTSPRMGVHIRWVDFTGLYITFYLRGRHAGAGNSMQYLVLGLAWLW